MAMTVMAQRMLSKDDIDDHDLHTTTTTESDEVWLVSTIDHLTIPPQHDARTLRVNVKNSPNRCTGIIMPDLESALKHNGGFLSRSSVMVDDRHATTVIMNLNQSHESVTFKPALHSQCLQSRARSLQSRRQPPPTQRSPSSTREMWTL